MTPDRYELIAALALIPPHSTMWNLGYHIYVNGSDLRTNEAKHVRSRIYQATRLVKHVDQARWDRRTPRGRHNEAIAIRRAFLPSHPVSPPKDRES